ncbi:MAG: S9 family peptidase, partial [Planctomycetaceae bacterium]|nr:S9 family peptidase [Planctomycetaceae bacterium]
MYVLRQIVPVIIVTSMWRGENSRRVWSVVAAVLLSATSTSTVAQLPVPDTRVEVVTDQFHGVAVSENYRWLEDANNPDVKAWNHAQNTYSRSYLSGLPGTADLRRRITELMLAETVSYGELACRGGQVFAMKRQPPKQQPFLVVMSDAARPEDERILLDPENLNTQGTTAIDWFEPSPDGALVAVSLSSGGSEAGDVHIFSTETGKQLFEVVPRVNTGTAGGDLAWAADSSGFFYTRHPRAGERPVEDLNFYQRAFFHQLGTDPATDRYELGDDFPRIAEIEFEMHDPSGQLLLTVQDGDGGQFAHYLRSSDGRWQQFSRFDDDIIQVTFGAADSLLAMSRQDAPRGKLIRIDISSLDVDRAETIIPEETDTIVNTFYHAAPSIVATESHVFVLYQQGGPSVIKTFDHQGKPVAGPRQPDVASVGGMTVCGSDSLLFHSETFISPREIWHYNSGDEETARLPLSSTSPASFSDIEVYREFAVSKDGTPIPLNIMRPAGAAATKPHPCIVYGYGGYGINLTPRFSVVRRVLFDAGIIYVVANLRGGGEYGEEWHRQGMLTRKQNVFDDFAAACQHMIDSGATTSAQLATMGGSNGGLLMGATLTQHPDLMKCVVSSVGIYDMLRVELSPNG